MWNLGIPICIKGHDGREQCDDVANHDAKEVGSGEDDKEGREDSDEPLGGRQSTQIVPLQTLNIMSQRLGLGGAPVRLSALLS